MFFFGYCNDYTNIVYGMKDTLTLVRDSDNDAIFHAAGVDAAATEALDSKVLLGKISWFMPHVTPGNMYRLRLYQTIEEKVNVAVAFRSRQCDTITVPQSTTFSWRLSVETAPEKPRYVIMA